MRTVEILKVETKISKTKNKYFACEAIVRGDSPTDIKVGGLTFFPNTVVPAEGLFAPEFDLDSDYKHRIAARITKLVPVSEAGHRTPVSRRLTILAVEHRVSQKGNPFAACQCVIRGSEPTDVKVGVLMVWGDKIVPAVGEFTASFDLGVDFDGQVSAEIVGLVPVSSGDKKKPASANAAA